MLTTLPEILNQNVLKHPRQKCLIFNQKKISYRDLNNQVDKLSRGLIKLGVNKGDRVAILLKNNPEYVINYFAILKAGAIVIPLNYMLAPGELKFILGDSKTSVIITSSEFIEIARQLRLRLDHLENIVTIDGNFPDTIAFSALFENVGLIDLARPIESEDVACILYTSGTTGQPKGVMLTHRNLISNVTACINRIRITDRDNFLCLLPIFHSFTLTICILMPIYVGARITIIESVRPFKKVLKAIITNRVTIFIGVPPIYNILKDFKIPRILSLRIFRFLNPLRLCISGADKLPTETLNKFESKFKIPLIEGYGLTEASPAVAVNPLIGQRKPGSVGPPLLNIKIKVLDESENELPPDQVGELLVKGPNVMKGYLNLADETSLAIKEGWLYTGDMARVDKDGYIYLVDRKKDIIIIRGLNVYPKEIEDVLYQHPRVAEAGVIGIKDKYKGEVPKAFVVLEKGGEITEQEIIHFCRQRLAPYKIPRSIEFRTSLPKTPTGKILKKELR